MAEEPGPRVSNGVKPNFKEDTVDINDFFITTFCMIDDTSKELLGDRRLRRRGPMPTLADSEVVTMEVVGEYLSLDQDKAIFDCFRRYYTHLFPAVGTLHRTTFVRQAGNLCAVKEMIWQHMPKQAEYDPSLKLVDSFPLPACQFAWAYRCRRFTEQSDFGHDTLLRQTFYGFRVHALVSWPGVIVSFAVVPASVDETAVVPDLVGGRQGTILGDRNYWSPKLKAELAE